MLLSKTTKIRWHSSNKKYYEEKDYIFTKMKDEFEVKVEDLPEGSNAPIECLCDYCLEKGIRTIVEKPYDRYIKERKFLEKDTCKKCNQIKRVECSKLRQIKNPDKNKEGYYLIRENLEKDFIEYINTHENINGMENNEFGTRLISGLEKNNETAFTLAKKLGYNINKISKRKPNNYYDNYEDFKNKILEIIKELGHFPTREELKSYNIFYKDIRKFKTISELKNDIRYEEIYIDNNNYRNHSYYELYTANFLIANGLGDKYLRDKKPFPNTEKKYESDFYFKSDNGKDIYVEVWGYPNKYLDTNKRAKEYNEKRKEKERLYKKYNLELISIESELFLHQSYDNIIKSLNDIFSKYLNLEYKTVSMEQIMSPCTLTNEELKNIIGSLAVNNILPKVSDLRENTGYRKYYNEILKRFKNYNTFAEQYGFELEFNSNKYWNKETIFKYFDNIISEYGYILERSALRNSENKDFKKLGHILSTTKFGYIDIKLEYLKTIDNIPDKEIEWLYNISKKIGSSSKYITNENQLTAQKIMDKLKSQGKLSSIYQHYICENYTDDHNVNLIYDMFFYLIENYGKILSNQEYHKYKKQDTYLSRVDIFKRMERNNISFRKIKNDFYEFISQDKSHKIVS